mmetsp:Transcript_58245/g.96567  ORF Transcript_58245/g.96567 Transcript_58245/m.96567 type:complete len:155 (+) Transcript_58245:55-519(+)|eukprot:CAMPEP_0202691968 /NCGR_PEP_ID=MMETSP1385-20130828/6499_1 /ASSEMBLY_ACC=CAM_ASM_000861 /TAXON_ID=933848 /ORGANISM="Elphidium margaritaceum" /LENGTH=154 /DNA_ID=CAMNT_0049347433 /DNA_START=43 /DNA_END=507 /DNA_ORIENTATION=-
MAQPNSKAVKRLQKELKKLKKEPVENASAEPDGKDMMQWIAIVKGPKGSAYEGGKFKVLISFTDDYPMKAPELKFQTKVYHPSVKSDDGTVCPEVIGKDWAPTLNVLYILETLIGMLQNPESDSPLEPEIAEILVKDKKKFEKTAKQWTKKHAK